jgi:hypothetical protein
MNQDDLLCTALIGAAIAFALFIRLRRIGRWQRLRPGALWIVPAIFALLAAMVLWQLPPHGTGWLWVAFGFAAGGFFGWQRGRLVEIRVDPDSGSLLQRSSPTAFLFLGLLVVVRWGLHGAIGLIDARWHLGAMLVSNIFIAFAVGVLGFYRLEVYLCARRLLG